MALPKLYDRAFWNNNTTPAVNADNLNALSKGASDIDDRLIALAGTIMEDVPQIQQDIEELEEDFALIDGKIADATSEANRATTKANEAAASVISAENKALISEGYAKGTQNGTPVGSSSPYYHNNAEYFKEQARSFTPEGYQDLVDDVAEAQEAITDIEGEKVSSNDAYVLRQCKGNMVDLGLVGGSIAWNQLVVNGNFADGVTNWATARVNTSVSNNILTLTATAENGIVYRAIPFIAEHKYLISFDGMGSVAGETNPLFTVYSGAWASKWEVICESTSFKNYSSIISASSGEVQQIRMRVDKTTITNKFKNVQIFDLTQKFGSTIADYIYSLEQATAGAGVAWFRKYFPNAYYAYQSGKIESVNVANRKAVGFNQWDEQLELGMYNTDTGEKASATTTLRNVNKIDVFPNTVYYCCSNILIRYLEYDANGKYLGTNTTTNTTFRTQKDTAYLNIQCGLNYEYICINISKTTGTPKNGDYVPYNGTEYPFANKQLRGIFYLDANNKLCANGDIWRANGGITRKYGIVDMGTLNWKYNSTNNFFWLDPDVIPIKQLGNLLCVPYVYVGAKSDAEMASVDNKSMALSAGKNIKIKDTSYSDAATFKTAMSGVYLVYELATPTIESANAYQNPQRAFIDGTEEFVDAGVTASTRDVSIPVGNESEYNTSVVLPISQDYTDGAMEILKEIVASSSDFADFKTKVAAL